VAAEPTAVAAVAAPPLPPAKALNCCSGGDNAITGHATITGADPLKPTTQQISHATRKKLPREARFR
jgi:hypothetical protein